MIIAVFCKLECSSRKQECYLFVCGYQLQPEANFSYEYIDLSYKCNAVSPTSSTTLYVPHSQNHVVLLLCCKAGNFHAALNSVKLAVEMQSLKLMVHKNLLRRGQISIIMQHVGYTVSHVTLSFAYCRGCLYVNCKQQSSKGNGTYRYNKD